MLSRRGFLRACRGALLGAAIAFPSVSLGLKEGEGWESEEPFFFFSQGESNAQFGFDGGQWVADFISVSSSADVVDWRDAQQTRWIICEED